jgi:hypothetical protein
MVGIVANNSLSIVPVHTTVVALWIFASRTLFARATLILIPIH